MRLTAACTPVMSVCVSVLDMALCVHDALHLCEQSEVVPLNLLRTFLLNLGKEIVVAVKPYSQALPPQNHSRTGMGMGATLGFFESPD